MRAAALLLLVSLVSPAVMSAVCELSCLQALHHAPGQSGGSDCHGHGGQPADGPLLAASGGALCHDEDTGPPAATAAGAAAPVPVPATVVAWIAAAPGLHAGVVQHTARARAPDRLPITTPLRI
jgi:hypothetical protein